MYSFTLTDEPLLYLFFYSVCACVSHSYSCFTYSAYISTVSSICKIPKFCTFSRTTFKSRKCLCLFRWMVDRMFPLEPALFNENCEVTRWKLECMNFFPSFIGKFPAIRKRKCLESKLICDLPRHPSKPSSKPFIHFKDNLSGCVTILCLCFSTHTKCIVPKA